MKQNKKRTAVSTDDRSNRSDWLHVLVLVSSFGFTLLGSIGVGIAVGYVADRYLHIAPWGLIGFGLFGAFSGFYSVYKQVLAYLGEPLKQTKEKT